MALPMKSRLNSAVVYFQFISLRQRSGYREVTDLNANNQFCLLTKRDQFAAGGKGAKGGKPGGKPNGKQANGSAMNGKSIPAKNGSAKATESELEPLSTTATTKKEGQLVETLHNVTLNLKQGMLLGVCGAVGSGKTSLIQAILGMVGFISKTQVLLYTTPNLYFLILQDETLILFYENTNSLSYTFLYLVGRLVRII